MTQLAEILVKASAAGYLPSESHFQQVNRYSSWLPRYSDEKNELNLVKCTRRRETVIDSPLCLPSELSHNFVLNYSHPMIRL